jgi:hypothetical protein
MKNFEKYKVYVFIVPLYLLLGCRHEKNVEIMTKPLASDTTSGKNLRYKNDSRNFYFSIDTNRKDSLKSSDSIIHRNIFLIQPRRIH